MEKIRAFAQGKKSYFVIGVGIICGIAQMQGIAIPTFVWEGLGALLGITLKSGQNRVENSTAELLAALKEANKSE